ncbi:unnamed protein product [Effrenium voratum]|uniref:Uncharacterized protein n=1 Tax=Effrenium voratum TaxID=2562239 RepID=A0AA36MYE7_9DINO|nr:unnamed protein product [Effrenium voratum]
MPSTMLGWEGPLLLPRLCRLASTGLPAQALLPERVKGEAADPQPKAARETSARSRLAYLLTKKPGEALVGQPCPPSGTAEKPETPKKAELEEERLTPSEPAPLPASAPTHGSDGSGGSGGSGAALCECGSPAEMGRVFAEQNFRRYCQRCWESWEKCGRWWPAIRVSTCPPRQTGQGAQFSAEDAFVLPGFLCDQEDGSLLAALQAELQREGKALSDWHGSRHLGLQFESGLPKAEDDLAGPAGAEAGAGLRHPRRGGAPEPLPGEPGDYKPLHYDRGRDNEGVPQLTVGASLGGTRELTLMHLGRHVKSGVTMSFPQRNGDVFAFTPELNEVFMHGVPRVLPNSPSAHEPADTARMSLIVWGPRVGACRGMGSSSSAFYTQGSGFRQRGILSEVVKPHRRQEVDSCRLGPVDLGTCSGTLRKSASATSFSLSDRLRAKAQEAEPKTPRKTIQDVEPKVIEVYAHKAGGRPRKVTVERRRKWFEALDVVALLEERNCNFSPNWDREFWLQLDDFNNTEFDIRTPEQWLQLGKQPDGSFLPLQAKAMRFHETKGSVWEDCTVEGLKDGKGTKDFLVRFPDFPDRNRLTESLAGGEPCELEPVGRLRIVLQGEDPEVFADRILYAFEALQKARADAVCGAVCGLEPG